MLTSQKDIEKIVKHVFRIGLDNKAIISKIKATTHEVYIVLIKSNKYAIRIATKEQPKLYTELWVLKNQKRLHIPGPKLIKWDDTKKIVPYNFMVETCVEGEHIHKKNKIRIKTAYKSLSNNILSRIHKQQMLGFGPLNASGKGEYPTWKVFIEAKFKKAFPEIKKRKLLPEKELILISQLHERNIRNMNIKSSRLILGDLHPKNFYFKNNLFSGFIDLKSVMAGDPLWEYALIEYYLGIRMWPEYIRKTQQALRRYSYYLILITLNKLWFCFKNGYPTKTIIKRLQTYIKSL